VFTQRLVVFIDSGQECAGRERSDDLELHRVVERAEYLTDQRACGDATPDSAAHIS
jgi:hypothetical protein